MAYQTVNPATNQLIKEYPSHTDADVEAALKAADALYHSDWAKATLTSACRYCVNLRTSSTNVRRIWPKLPARRWVSSLSRAAVK